MSNQVDESPVIPVSIDDAGEESGRSAARTFKANEQLMRSHVHYVGFRSTDEGREYTLRATNETPRLFVLLIAHQHFQMGRARYQDGPDLCCSKLTRVLIEDALGPDQASPLVLTAEELALHRAQRADPAARRRKDHRSDTESVQ